MKKFSWIFALILALSLVFIACPVASDDDDSPSTGSKPPVVTPPVEPPYEPNLNAVEIPITFGTAAGQTEVLFEKGDGSQIGKVVYANGGYTYTYDGDLGAESQNLGDDGKNGNAIGRFKVDLGDFHLGDYGGVEFKWKGISGDAGLSNGDAAHPEWSKNLFILASDSEGGLTPWKSDGDLKSLLIVNTDYFVTNPSANIYSGDAGVPCVKGLAGYPAKDKPVGVTEPYTIATPFVLKKTLTGEVWLAFYLHAGGGSYEITDAKLVPVTTYVKKDPPPAPPAITPDPPPPASIPKGYTFFDLDLSDWETVGAEWTAGANYNPEGEFANGKLTLTFDKARQRVNFKLTDPQIETLKSRSDNNGVVIIEGTITDGSGAIDSWRCALADADAGSNWSATTLVSGKFSEILVTNAVFPGQNAEPKYFVIQKMDNDGPATIEITKITVAVKPGIPAGYTPINVDISDWETIGYEWTVGANDKPVGAFADGKLTATFTKERQRINFKLTPEQVATIKSHTTDEAYIIIDGNVTDETTTGDSFRHALANAEIGSNWGASTITTGSLASILSVKAAFSASQGAEPFYFVLQHMNGNSVTIEIRAITIGVKAGVVVTLNSIAVKTPPTQDTYQIDVTEFDPDGLVITATYSDSSTEDIAYGTANASYFTFNSGITNLIPGTSTFDTDGEKEITVTYKGKTDTFTVTVQDTPPPEVVSFVIKTQPTKLTYIINSEPFNPAGLEITATYDDDSEKDIAYVADKFTFKRAGSDLIIGTSTLPVTGANVITVIYEGITGTDTITATGKDYSSIEVTTPPTKDSYIVGIEKFNVAGLKITATFTDNSTSGEIAYASGNAADFAFANGATDLIVGTSTFDAVDTGIAITVTYKGKPALKDTFDIDVVAAPASGTVVWQPTITEETPMKGGTGDPAEYVGDTGIKKDSGASEITLAAIEDGFTVTVNSGSYKQFCIQVGSAAGGTSYYTTPEAAFTAITGLSYTITFNVSVEDGTGQLRANANGTPSGSDSWAKDQALDTDPTEFTYSWTQGSGNLKFDTGSTAETGKIIITDIVITIQ